MTRRCSHRETGVGEAGEGLLHVNGGEKNLCNSLKISLEGYVQIQMISLGTKPVISHQLKRSWKDKVLQEVESDASNVAIFHFIFHLKFNNKITAFAGNVPSQLQCLHVCDA